MKKETKQIISLDVVYLVTLEQTIPKKRLMFANTLMMNMKVTKK